MLLLLLFAISAKAKPVGLSATPSSGWSEGKRNPYWQMAIDHEGVILLFWVWRESPDIGSKHVLCYAKLSDRGMTWQRADEEKYAFPIRIFNAEFALNIHQGSDLINQTSMLADVKGNVFIASYWRDEQDKILQYHLVDSTNCRWKSTNLNFRKTAFSLTGSGTKRIPISRSQVIIWPNGKNYVSGLIFRDEERNGWLSIARNADIEPEKCRIEDLTKGSVGDWEPTYYTELRQNKSPLSLFLQDVKTDSWRGQSQTGPTAVAVLDWISKNKFINDQFRQ